MIFFVKICLLIKNLKYLILPKFTAEKALHMQVMISTEHFSFLVHHIIKDILKTTAKYTKDGLDFGFFANSDSVYAQNKQKFHLPHIKHFLAN